MDLLEIVLLLGGGVATISLFLGWVTKKRAAHLIDYYSDVYGEDYVEATIVRKGEKGQ